MYEKFLPPAFQWVVRGEPSRLRRLAAQLLDDSLDSEDYPYEGTSFAVTVRPHFMLWLSDASHDRLRGQFTEADEVLRTGHLMDSFLRDAPLLTDDKQPPGSDG